MALLTVAELALAYGKKLLFEHASFHLGAGEKVALVGPNGSGKTTLFQLLAGVKEPDEGEVHLGKNVHLAWLPQEISELPPGTLVQSVRASVPGKEALEREERELHDELATAEDDEARTELAARLAELHERLADFEARFGRHRAEELLSGLGFREADFERPIGHFSGGWKMRAALAGLLLVDPDVLLLDEPTNHLDVPSQAWLDGFLDRSRAAVLFVSHDRGFVNRHARRVLAIEPEGIRSYPGGFDDYKRLRAEEAVNLQLKAERVEKQRAELQRFIDRFRAKASKARQAQSRVKMLERLETVRVHEERSTVAFRFPPAERSGKEVLRVEGLRKRFGDKIVWREASALVQRGDRIAIVGANGAGKTTLLKMVAGELPPDEGAVTLGHNVKPAYFAQHHTEKLDAKKTILEEIHGLAPTQPQSWVRGILGSFLFSGDEVEKRISVLSGGERARVSLASLLVVPTNLLLMDEPTNHLDLDSVERLTEALAQYDGTLVFVSHDRGFVDTLATKVWDVRDGTLHEWPGNLTSWIEHLAAEGVPWASASAPRAVKRAGGESDKERRQREAKEREERRRALGPLQKRLAALEAEISAAEREQGELEVTLADPGTYADRTKAEALGRRRGELTRLLEERYAAWEATGAELEAAAAALGQG